MYVRVLGEYTFLTCVTVRDRGKCQGFERRYRFHPSAPVTSTFSPCSIEVLYEGLVQLTVRFLLFDAKVEADAAGVSATSPFLTFVNTDP